MRALDPAVARAVAACEAEDQAKVDAVRFEAQWFTDRLRAARQRINAEHNRREEERRVETRARLAPLRQQRAIEAALNETPMPSWLMPDEFHLPLCAGGWNGAYHTHIPGAE